MTDETDLTGLDAELRAMATRLMDEHADARLPNKAWLEDTIFRAMQAYATIRAGSDRSAADLMVGCERIGRLKAESVAARSIFA